VALVTAFNWPNCTLFYLIVFCSGDFRQNSVGGGKVGAGVSPTWWQPNRHAADKLGSYQRHG